MFTPNIPLMNPWALFMQPENPEISVSTSNGTNHFGLVRLEYSGPALKVVHSDQSSHFSWSDWNVPFHLTKLCLPQYRSFVSCLQEQYPNVRWLGWGLCNRNVPFHWAHEISEISNWNFCWSHCCNQFQIQICMPNEQWFFFRITSLYSVRLKNL